MNKISQDAGQYPMIDDLSEVVRDPRSALVQRSDRRETSDYLKNNGLFIYHHPTNH